jgi:hypothetical protein
MVMMKSRKKIRVILCSMIILPFSFGYTASSAAYKSVPEDLATFREACSFFFDLPYLNNDFEIQTADIDEPDDGSINHRTSNSHYLNFAGDDYSHSELYLQIYYKFTAPILCTSDFIFESGDLPPPYILG